MGIPRFFKMLTERYPLSVEVKTEETNSQCDNFYIDMNGIIHTQTHDNAKAAAMGTWETYSAQVCSYVDQLFRIARPEELLFLSVDGPVCRMKMNQQRSRRFLKTEESEAGFDPNCISPGTEFMEFLQEKLLDFIRHKKATDALWGKVAVVFSGHRVPGEGEHKIVSYLRNTADASRQKRHCIHGMDADLILLTLLTSMPHFSILREEMDLRNSRTGKFILLHTHIIRDYLALEMGMPAADGVVHRLVDDIVLVMTLFGNDFVPGAFSLLEAFDDVVVLYGRHIKTTGKYLHQRGEIDWSALERFLGEVAAYEKICGLCKLVKVPHPPKQFSYKDAAKWLQNHKAAFFQEAEALLQSCPANAPLPFVTKSLLLSAKTPGAKITHPVLKHVLAQAGHRNAKPADKEVQAVLQSLQQLPVLENLKPAQAVEKVWELVRKQRYQAKGIDSRYAVDYLLSVEWLSKYYFTESSSWTWYYPCHYPVFISDVHAELARILETVKETPAVRVSDYLAAQRDYHAGEPVRPFVQLLSILSAKSQALVPKALREVFVELAEYYPATFAVDKDGKKAWEALCLIPFVDVRRIEQAVAQRIARVPAAELVRNQVDTLKVWPEDSEQWVEFPGAPPLVGSAYRSIPAIRTGPARLATPSLFAKRVVPTMSRIVNPRFQPTDRKRMVLKVMPCRNIMKELDSWMSQAQANRTQPFMASAGLEIYIGFPYLNRCQVSQVVYKNQVFAVSSTGEVNRGVSHPAHLKDLEKASKQLFREKGIFVEDRKSYAVCTVRGQEVVCPLEVLIGHYQA